MITWTQIVCGKIISVHPGIVQGGGIHVTTTQKRYTCEKVQVQVVLLLHAHVQLNSPYTQNRSPVPEAMQRYNNWLILYAHDQ